MSQARWHRLAWWTGLSAGGFLALGLTGPESAVAQGMISEGFVIEKEHWSALQTYAGYMDWALNRRAGFEGREYLSGEWVAAIGYAAMPPMRLPRYLLFPDWETNSDFDQESDIAQADPANPLNQDGFPVWRSARGNSQLQIENFFEMLDSESGIAQGFSPASAAGPGESVVSDRYVFRHRYQITNRSGQTLVQVVFYQMLHGLESGIAVFDNRGYGGPFAEYHYDIAERGTSYSFHKGTGAIYQHEDVVALHAMAMPSAFEVNYYGVRGIDSHVLGKPSQGVPLSIEAGQLNGTDFFDPPESGWGAGALVFELGDLGPGQTRELSCLFTVSTESTLKYERLELPVLPPWIEDGNFIIEARDPMMLRQEIGLGFSLFSTTDLHPFSAETWNQELVPLFFNPAQPERFWFSVPFDPALPHQFFVLRPLLGFGF